MNSRHGTGLISETLVLRLEDFLSAQCITAPEIRVLFSGPPNIHEMLFLMIYFCVSEPK